MNNPLVQVDPGLYFWTIFVFLVLAFLLRAFAWKPLLKALDDRRKTIEGAVDDARKAREELERVQQDSARMMAEARREGEALLTRARQDADRFREDLRTQAVAEAANISKNAEKQLQQETARAIAQIRKEAGDLSVEIASKILRRAVSKADHEQLIDDVVRQVQ